MWQGKSLTQDKFTWHCQSCSKQLCTSDLGPTGAALHTYDWDLGSKLTDFYSILPFFCLLLFWSLCPSVMVSRHRCLHLWTRRRLCPCHFIWVLARLRLFIICCWVFLMWSGNHCPVCAWLSNVSQLGFFWDTRQIRPSSSSAITNKYTKVCLLASWHQCPYKPQAWGCYTQSLLPAGEVSFQPLSWSQFQTCLYVLPLENNNHAVNMKSKKVTKPCCSVPWKDLLCGPSFAESKVTGPC